MEKYFKFDPEEQKGYQLRYKTWIENVNIWAKQYGITTEQAIQILFEDIPSLNKKITAEELLSWAESDEFYFDFKEEFNLNKAKIKYKE